MPIFERPPLDSLAPAKNRWTPIYLEHGRLEVDDSSVKWIGKDGLITRLPVATVSALILGPGTTITHAAVKAAAQCNCPLFWLGEDGLKFYAFGITPNHDNSMARIHATAWANKKSQNEIARRMFLHRFPEASVHGVNIKQLRGMEGKRVKQTYAELGAKYGVTWKGRDYKTENWQIADGINRALSASNASLYALTAAVCCSMVLFHSWASSMLLALCHSSMILQIFTSTRLAGQLLLRHFLSIRTMTAHWSANS
jgi:CRISPR-associated protein Cas1